MPMALHLKYRCRYEKFMPAPSSRDIPQPEPQTTHWIDAPVLGVIGLALKGHLLDHLSGEVPRYCPSTCTLLSIRSLALQIEPGRHWNLGQPAFHLRCLDARGLKVERTNAEAACDVDSMCVRANTQAVR